MSVVTSHVGGDGTHVVVMSDVTCLVVSGGGGVTCLVASAVVMIVACVL
jgi:hypothetical protein